MRVLLDTNIVLDCCDSNRKPFHDTCMTLVWACVEHDVDMLVSVSSLNDAYYVLSKRYGEPFARASVRTLLTLFDIEPLLVRYAVKAVDSTEPDFEDGLIRAMAEDLHCDALVTRDARAFADAQVRPVNVDECLALIE